MRRTTSGRYWGMSIAIISRARGASSLNCAFGPNEDRRWSQGLLHPGDYRGGAQDNGREGGPQNRRMNEALSGKIALVTGGSRGIGRAIALKLAGAGCDIAIVYRSSHDEAESVCAAVRGLGRRAL